MHEAACPHETSERDTNARYPIVHKLAYAADSTFSVDVVHFPYPWPDDGPSLPVHAESFAGFAGYTHKWEIIGLIAGTFQRASLIFLIIVSYAACPGKNNFPDTGL